MVKMKKRILSLALALILLCVLTVPALAANSDFVIENGVLVEYKGSGGNVVIPEGVTEIGDFVFWGCTDLTGVTIPSSVTSIWGWAFRDCENLTSVVIPGSVAEIGSQAFRCTGLTSVTISEGVRRIGPQAFWSCEKLISVSIPNSVTYIGENAFSGCDRLTSISIPNGVTSIEAGTFRGCDRLSNVTIPGNIVSIERSAFAGCTSLKSVTISEGVTSIEESVFSGCEKLSTISIPKSVTYIGDEAFRDCTSLENVHYAGTKEEWDAIIIEDYNDPLNFATISYEPAEPEQPVAHPNTQTVTIDGRKVEFQIYSIKDEKGNDTSYIKIRDLALALKGTAAQFDVGQVNGVITFTSGGEYKPNGSENSTPYSGKQTYTKNNGEVSVNGTKYPIDAFQITHNGAGYTYFQLRDIAQKLNFNIAWRGGAVIETNKPYTGK